MFQLFNPDSNLPFMRWGRITVMVSCVLILAALVLMFRPGLNFGLDFTGGSLVELHFDDPVDLAEVRGKLADAGYPDAVVQTFGSARDIVVRLAPREGRAEAEELGREVQAELARAGLPSELKRNEFVGPQVGRELAEDGIVALVVVIIGILIYIAARFEWRFALAAIAGEIHDTVITVGFLVMIGMEIDLTVLAALLAVVGYSINDKIVVFDRIRENLIASRKLSPEEVVNNSVNTTLARTVITSFVTLLAVFALYFVGGPALAGFSLTLIVGVLVGTYSSILFASPILLKLGVTKQDLMPKVRDETELARRP
jgi:preprotein translocase subunit SecF